MNGFIKLHRKLMETPEWTCTTPEQKTVLITILLMANFKPNEWYWKEKKFTAKPGQFVTSLSKLAEMAGVSIQNVRTTLVKLENLQFLTNQSTKTGRLVTVINWDKYQLYDDDLTKNQQSVNKELTTTEEGKKDKKKRNVCTYPSLNEVKDYFIENGYQAEAGQKAWEYYEAGGWKDSQGKTVKSWKQKMRGVWFKPEHKAPEKKIIVNPSEIVP